MVDVRDAAEELLEERPKLEDGLQSVLEVDGEEDSWDFGDVPLDSGAFGEVVSRGIVERTDDGYRVADRSALATVLGDHSVDRADPDVSGDGAGIDLDESLRRVAVSFDGRTVLPLVGVLSLVALFRVLPFPSVFRGEDIVFSANDPYYYRFWVESLVARADGPFDVGVLSDPPPDVSLGEPLLVGTLWWLSELFGGAPSTVGLVMAWYPVIAGLVASVLVYLIAVKVTADRRVGLAAVSLLAVIPMHATRTALGFPDHHAFDYIWLTVTALVLVALVDRDVDRQGTWGLATVLGIAVAAQTLAWEAGPLLLVPIGGYVAVRVLWDVRVGASPLEENLPVAGGIALATVIVHLAHVGLGWHSPVVAYAPLLLLAGIVGVVLVAEAVHRDGRTPRELIAAETVGAMAVGIVLWVALPSTIVSLTRGLNFLLTTEGIAERLALFGGELDGIVGPLILVGFVMFLALAYLLRITWLLTRQYEADWLLLAVYGWYFLVLSLLQIRFLGEFAAFLAVFGGLGFVEVAAWLDLMRPSGVFPSDSSSGGAEVESLDRRRALYLGGLWAGVGGLGALMTPVKQWQLATERETYAAATQMQTYAAERGLEHPESYVFSSWGSNRTYNYFVNGESRSYAFAREQYPAFAASTDEESWARELSGDAGFVVTDDDDLSDASDLPEDTLYRQLHEGYGIDTGHFRAIWASGDESKKAFALVPGATVTGPGEPGATVTLRREGSVGETTFTFERSVPVNDHGVFTTRLPQPGDFSLGEGRVTIPESAVEAGEAVSLFSGPGAGYWSFDEGEGSTAHDRVGGRHATLAGDADWTEGISGSAIQLGRSGYVQLPLSTAPQFSLSFWIRPAAVDATDENDFRHVVHGRRGDLLVLEEWESITLRVPGVTDDGWSAGSIPTGEWTHVVATYDGSRRAIFVDGELAGRDSTEGGPAEWGEWLRVGARTADGTAHGFEGAIDELRVFETALGEDRVEGLFRSGRE